MPYVSSAKSTAIHHENDPQYGRDVKADLSGQAATDEYVHTSRFLDTRLPLQTWTFSAAIRPSS